MKWAILSTWNKHFHRNLCAKTDFGYSFKIVKFLGNLCYLPVSYIKTCSHWGHFLSWKIYVVFFFLGFSWNPCGIYCFHVEQYIPFTFVQKYRGLSQFMKLLNRDGKWKNKLYCHGIVLATFCLWVVDPDLTLNNL